VNLSIAEKGEGKNSKSATRKRKAFFDAAGTSRATAYRAVANLRAEVKAQEKLVSDGDQKYVNWEAVTDSNKRAKGTGRVSGLTLEMAVFILKTVAELPAPATTWGNLHLFVQGKLSNELNFPLHAENGRLGVAVKEFRRWCAQIGLTMKSRSVKPLLSLLQVVQRIKWVLDDVIGVPLASLPRDLQQSLVDNGMTTTVGEALAAGVERDQLMNSLSFADKQTLHEKNRQPFNRGKAPPATVLKKLRDLGALATQRHQAALDYKEMKAANQMKDNKKEDRESDKQMKASRDGGEAVAKAKPKKKTKDQKAKAARKAEAEKRERDRVEAELLNRIERLRLACSSFVPAVRPTEEGCCSLEEKECVQVKNDTLDLEQDGAMDIVIVLMLQDLTRVVHVDETWMRVTKDNSNSVEFLGDNDPRYAAMINKQSPEQVMFITAVGQPAELDSHSVDGKYFCEPIGAYQDAKKLSEAEKAAGYSYTSPETKRWKNETVNAERYMLFLKMIMIVVAIANIPFYAWGAILIIQHDGARPHTAARVAGEIRFFAMQIFRICGVYIQVLQQPSRSPDTNLNDMSIYDVLKKAFIRIMNQNAMRGIPTEPHILFRDLFFQLTERQLCGAVDRVLCAHLAILETGGSNVYNERLYTERGAAPSLYISLAQVQQGFEHFKSATADEARGRVEGEDVEMKEVV